MTWAQYESLAYGFHRREEKEWERTRWMTWHLVNIHLGKEHKLDSPASLLRLAKDASQSAVPTAEPALTKEEKLARAKHLDPDKFSQ